MGLGALIVALWITQVDVVGIYYALLSGSMLILGFLLLVWPGHDE